MVAKSLACLSLSPSLLLLPRLALLSTRTAPDAAWIAPPSFPFAVRYSSHRCGPFFLPHSLASPCAWPPSLPPPHPQFCRSSLPSHCLTMLSHQVPDYEAFEDMVKAAHLRPMTEDVTQLDLKRSSWLAGSRSGSGEPQREMARDETREERWEEKQARAKERKTTEEPTPSRATRSPLARARPRLCAYAMVRLCGSWLLQGPH